LGQLDFRIKPGFHICRSALHLPTCDKAAGSIAGTQH
jgi:hypothetical protein